MSPHVGPVLLAIRPITRSGRPMNWRTIRLATTCPLESAGMFSTGIAWPEVANPSLSCGSGVRHQPLRTTVPSAYSNATA